MQEQLRKILWNCFHFFFSNILSFGLGLVASVVMARTLGPNDLGIYHQVAWFSGTVSVIISLGFITSITKFTAQYKAAGQTARIGAAIRFIFIVEGGMALVSTLGLLLFASHIADYYFNPKQVWLFSLSFIAITPGIQTAIFSATLEGAQIFKYQTVHAFTVTPLAIITKVYLLINHYGLISLFWCNLAFAVINLSFFYWAVKREGLLQNWRNPKEIESDVRKEIWKYNRSLIGIHFLDLIVWSRSENYFLGRFCAAPQIAYYNLAQNLVAKLTGLIPTLMWKLLLPLTAAQHGRSEHEKLHRTFTQSLRISGLAAFPTIVTCFISAYELIIIFFGHEYSEVKNCFQVLCIGALFTSLTQAGSAAIYASNRQKFILYYGSVLAVLNLGLNFYIIPKYGAMGASISYSLTTTLGVLGGFIFTTQQMHLKLPWRAWLKCALASVIMAVVLSKCLHQEFLFFHIFDSLQVYLKNHIGHDLHYLLGARTVRFACSIFIAILVYIVGILLLFRPNADDLKMLHALQKIFPRINLRMLYRKKEI